MCQAQIRSQCVLTRLGDPALPSGPYFVSAHTHILHAPFLLYVDTQGYFTTGIIPAVDDSFNSIPVAIAASSSTTIGVPSRLYFRPTEEKPLARVRLGLKDLYDLKRSTAGAGSRAYFDLNPKRTTPPNTTVG